MGHRDTDNRTALSRYFSEIREYGSLSREDEVRLSEAAREGSVAARDELVRCNLGFVAKVAGEYRNLGVPLEDLLNEGNLGLIEAAHRYDANKGTKFITYAIWWIRKSILRALSERSTLVRVPGYQLRKVREIRQVERQLSRSLGRRPMRDEISEQLASSVAKIDQMLQLGQRQVDIDDRAARDSDRPLSECLADASQASAESGLLERESRDLIAEALEALTEQERTVVRARYGLDGSAPQTLRQIGKFMNISRERVRQIECQAKTRIRRMLLVRHHPSGTCH